MNRRGFLKAAGVAAAGVAAGGALVATDQVYPDKPVIDPIPLSDAVFRWEKGYEPLPADFRIVWTGPSPMTNGDQFWTGTWRATEGGKVYGGDIEVSDAPVGGIKLLLEADLRKQARATFRELRS